MSEAIITVIHTQVTTIMDELLRKEGRSVGWVKSGIKNLGSQLASIKSVILDAEERQLKDKAVRVWLKRLEDVSYEIEDVLDECFCAMKKAEIEGHGGQSSPVNKKVCSFFTLLCLDSCSRIFLHRDIARKIRKVSKTLGNIVIEKQSYNFNKFRGCECPGRPKPTSFISVSGVEGRDVDKKTLISKLLSHKNQEKGISIVSVVGCGGIGKTTLAQLVYNSDDVIQHFDMRIWVCAADPNFDEIRMAKAILEGITGNDDGSSLFELETVAGRIRNHVEGKKFLLVLDNVWTEDFRKWEQIYNSLKIGGAGSKILLTTRNESVAKVMGSSYQLRLGNLSEDDSWSLFKNIAFFEQRREDCERFENIGRMIARKCKGLPLAIKTVSSLMRFKKSLNDWQDVLDSEFWEVEDAEGLFPSMMLSYYDLPSTMRQCFAYCAIFPRDHVIAANNLIQLWMAEGFLNSSGNVEMEVIGQEYVRNLAVRSFFQDLVRDERNGERILSLKIHNVVHDFANYINKKKCSVIEFNNDFQRRTESSHKMARHLTVIRAEDTQFLSIPNVKKLFTLRVQSFYNSPPIINRLDLIEPDLICRLESLRALDLSRNKIGELPKEIGNLIKLKYLNLSQNPCWELPDTLCDLYHLQTLKLYGCNHLRRLPSRICKLLNLRHLEIDHTDSLKTLPKGVGKLVSLQTLSKFIITRGVDKGDATCGLEDLKNLNNLQGCLRIEGLGYATSADEAKKAELQKKIHLSELEMDFSPSIHIGNQDEVIEAFEVHENVQSLRIISYGGTKFPKWMIKLIYLQNLFLQDCQNCTNLPPLGRLSSLVTLHLEGMKNIKYIGLELLGLHVNNKNMMNGEGGSEALSAFPNLKKLKISKMESWEEWNLISKDSGIHDGTLKIMPRLGCLKISHCSKLKALPPFLLQKTTVRKLQIDNCPLLQQQYNKEVGEDWSKISHITKIRVS